MRTPPYGAIKAALIEYTQTQALSYASKKIRVVGGLYRLESGRVDILYP